MDSRTRAVVAGLSALGLFALVQVGALALVEPFMDAGYQAVEDPSNPANSLFYVGVLLVATAAMLVVIRLDMQQVLRGVIVLTSGLVSLYVFSVVVPPVVVSAAGVPLNVAALAGAAVLAAALWVYPEWYVIDAAGVIMGAGAAAIFGISFGVLPAIVLLTVLAVYDAISVYGTEHMLTLASGVMEMKVPVILIVPLTPAYSFLDHASELGEQTADDESTATDDASTATDDAGDASAATDDTGDAFERDAFFIGLGDAVMPTIMVASAAFFSPAPTLRVAGLAVNLPAVGAMAGTLLGLVVLIGLVMRGRAHAGLPLLNGGAIGGYLIGAVLVGIPVVEALGLTPYL